VAGGPAGGAAEEGGGTRVESRFTGVDDITIGISGRSFLRVGLSGRSEPLEAATTEVGSRAGDSPSATGSTLMID